MTNEDVVKEIAFWALTRRRDAVGDHFDLSDDELGHLLSWLKEDIKLTIESQGRDRPDSEMTDSYNEQTDKEITDIILDPGRRLEKQEEYIKLIMQSLLDLSTIVLGPGWRDEPTGSFRYASNPKPGENFSPLIIERRHPSYDSAHGRKTDLQTLAEAMDELLGGTE